MTKIPQLQQLMEKPLSRKQFLQYVGVLIIGTFGITSAISRLLKEDHHSSISKSTGSKWGGGKFGV